MKSCEENIEMQGLMEGRRKYVLVLALQVIEICLYDITLMSTFMYDTLCLFFNKYYMRYFFIHKFEYNVLYRTCVDKNHGT